MPSTAALADESPLIRPWCEEVELIVLEHLHKNIALLTCHAAKRTEVELLRDFPDVLHPFDSKLGWDYDSVYVDDVSYHEGFGDAYKNYGVDKESGCVVVTRPDQYVGYVDSLDEEGFVGVDGYFKGVLA